MQQRSYGYINIDNSNNKESILSPNQENNRSNKKLRRLLTDDFSYFQNMNIRQIDQSNQDQFRPQTLKEMVNQAKIRFIENTLNSIISRQEKQTVPFYIKQRDDQLKKVKSFKSSIRQQDYKEDDVNKKVCIYLIEAFFVILLVLFTTELLLRKYLQ